MTPTRGRAPRGERCLGAAPHGHWKTTTFVAALRCDTVTAPLVLDGPIDGACFLAYVKQFLCATLRPGDVVIADNLSSHKVAGVREAIEATGATIRYLPPYAADPNSIGKLLAKLKTLRRRVALSNVEALWDHIGQLLDDFPPLGCSNYFRSCGYVSSQSENALTVARGNGACRPTAGP